MTFPYNINNKQTIQLSKLAYLSCLRNSKKLIDICYTTEKLFNERLITLKIPELIIVLQEEKI